MTKCKAMMGALLGGGIAGIFDIVYAILRNGQFGRPPLWVLQSVASGWTGEAAFESGVTGGVIGLASHFGIMLVFAAVYFAASRRLPVLLSRAVICGAVFGVLVYLFMNFVVLPLSAFPFTLKYPPLRLLEGFASHAVFIGIPIALAIRWSEKKS